VKSLKNCCSNKDNFYLNLYSVPDVIDCGHSLVGGCKTKEFLIENTGGEGRFLFIGEEVDAQRPHDIQWDEVSEKKFCEFSLIAC